MRTWELHLEPDLLLVLVVCQCEVEFRSLQNSAEMSINICRVATILTEQVTADLLRRAHWRSARRRSQKPGLIQKLLLVKSSPAQLARSTKATEGSGSHRQSRKVSGRMQGCQKAESCFATRAEGHYWASLRTLDRSPPNAVSTRWHAGQA